MLDLINHPVLEDSDIRGLDRRQVLKLGLAGALAGVVPLVFSGEAEAASSPWRANFRNAHTGESFNGVYRFGNKYLPEAFERINYVLRDFRAREVFPMDPRVVDIMVSIQKRAGSNRRVDILSGYRSPKTNAKLRRVSSGVAKNSFHMYGQALDIQIPGFSTRRVRDIAKSLKAGGVGYYAKSNFVHVDTGTVRSW